MSLRLAIEMEGWRNGIRWWLWDKRLVRCPYCKDDSDADWLAQCDCFMAEEKLR